MKVTMTLEDGPNSTPRFDAKTEGVDPEMKSMAYSVYVFLRMCMDILNSPYRSQLVSLIGELHKAVRNADKKIIVGGDDGNPGSRNLN